MTDLNDKLRAALKSAFLANGSSGPKYDAALLAEAINEIIATPAPQAAPNDGGEALKSMIDKGLTAIAQIAPVSPATKTWPEEIYLSTGEDDELAPFGEYSEVSWCNHPTNSVDVRYVREDVVARAAAWRAAAAPLTPAADQSAAGELLTDDEIEEAATDYYKPCTGLVQDVIGFARSIEYRTRAATPAAPLAQQSVPIGYVANTAHGWQFRTAAPDENSQWVGMWRAVGYISAQQSEPVAPCPMCKDKEHPRYVEWYADRTAEKMGTPFRAWLAAAYPSEYAAPLPAQQASESLYNAVEELRDYVAEDRGLDVNIDPIALLQSKAEESGGDFTVPSAHLWAVFQALAAMGDARKGGGDAQ